MLHEHREALRKGDLAPGAQHDFEFHRLIMVYSGNRAFVDLHASYRRVVLQSQFLSAQRVDRRWVTIVEHENILRRFDQCDAEGASYFMHVHVTRAADRVGASLNGRL